MGVDRGAWGGGGGGGEYEGFGGLVEGGGKGGDWRSPPQIHQAISNTHCRCEKSTP